MFIYLGCYTDATHPDGLSTLELDEASCEMRVVESHPVANALYQTLSPDGKWLYSCTGEGLASFRAQGPRLFAEDAVRLGGSCCHVAAMQDGSRVVFADYLGGFAGSVEVAEGRFGKIALHRHSGSGPNLPRQDRAHCHQALPTPDGAAYCVVDLGLDEVVTYPGGKAFATSPSGAGPRHLLFHPNGRLAFLVSELGNLVSSLRWSPVTGFELLDSLPTLRSPLETASEKLSDGSHLAAAIRFTPDMKRVVVSNRGEESLAVFDFDEATGRLAFRARTTLPGSWPRDFLFVSRDLALVAMERSGEVHALRYDAEAGTFSVAATLGGFFRLVALLAAP